MTAPIRAMIVDDEPLARARIRGLLARQPDLRLVAECADGAAAREAIEADRPEVVFLDIEMAEVSERRQVRPSSSSRRTSGMPGRPSTSARSIL